MVSYIAYSIYFDAGVNLFPKLSASLLSQIICIGRKTTSSSAFDRGNNSASRPPQVYISGKYFGQSIHTSIYYANYQCTGIGGGCD
jgi:hypothetical protein